MKGVTFVEFYKKYIELCNKIGKSPSAVSIELGLSKSTVNRWKNGGSPTDATAAKIASYFDVTVAYLKEFGEETKRQPAESELSIKKKEFIRKVEGMSDAQLERLEQILSLVENTDV